MLRKVSSLFSIADLTGAQDGSVRMFEWGHAQQITCFRSGGNSRVTRMRFNYQGNKVTDRMLCVHFTLTTESCKLTDMPFSPNSKEFL